MQNNFQYSSELKQALSIAQSIAKEHCHSHFSCPHLLKAIMHDDIGLTGLLKVLEKDVFYLREWADFRIENYPKSSVPVAEPLGDETINPVLEKADIVRLKLSRDTIEPICCLMALLEPNVAFTAEQLKTLPITYNELADKTLDKKVLEEAIYENKKPTDISKPIFKYCIDKILLAKENKIDPVIGRDLEILQIFEILGRRIKNNVLIIGDPGVGKTAIVDGLAIRIAQNQVPLYLQSSTLFELDLGALIAGASYKGEFEDRLKSVFGEIKKIGNSILFIDEIHTLMTEQMGSSASNLLKPELARGGLVIIGATTILEYRKCIEPDPAFLRRFEIIQVEEPDDETTVRMLFGLLPRFQTHYGITSEKEALSESVRLAKRYIQDRKLPDSAIDLLDHAFSKTRMMNETLVDEIGYLESKLQELSEKSKKVESLEFFTELQGIHRQLSNRICHTHFETIGIPKEDEDLTSSKILFKWLQKKLMEIKSVAGKKKKQIECADIAAVVSQRTGIPLGRIQVQEREKLLQMEEWLGQRIIGQDNAIQLIAQAVREARSGLTKPGQPIGSFFLLGPTGTGKTEMAKSLAAFLFDDEKSILRFDMSEFKEEHSAALLYGAPPGYVGYKEGGLLVNKIRQKPYAVVLFDEIEKAHSSVFDVFLQILDEGQLHDKLGNRGDFSNSILLFTSNIGSDWIVQSIQDGQIPDREKICEIMGKYFRPEFLGRITDIVPFLPLSESHMEKILDLQLKTLLDALNIQGIHLNISKEAKKRIIQKGFVPQFGARPLAGVIRTELRRPISKMIISGEAVSGNTIVLDAHPEKKFGWVVK